MHLYHNGPNIRAQNEPRVQLTEQVFCVDCHHLRTSGDRFRAPTPYGLIASQWCGHPSACDKVTGESVRPCRTERSEFNSKSQCGPLGLHFRSHIDGEPTNLEHVSNLATPIRG